MTKVPGFYPIPIYLKKVLSKNIKGPNPSINEESFVYMQILQALTRAKNIDLSESHYLSLMKLALYLEEYQCTAEVKKSQMFYQQIERIDARKNIFQFNVQEIDEERPWIKPNDLVDVRDSDGSSEIYTLKVILVQQNFIVAVDEVRRFCANYSKDALYHIKFRYNNYSLRCCHYALSEIRKHQVTTYLFPQKYKPYIEQGITDHPGCNMFNNFIATNYAQKLAVINILNKSSFPAPYIIYGPPGTGKTATLVEAICQVCYRSPAAAVLVCTPSNTAADEITKRLIEYISPRSIYRMYSKSKHVSTIDEVLHSCSNYDDGKVTRVTYADIVTKKIVITTLINCARLVSLRLRPGYFSHVFIDEAGQSTEPAVLIPISLVVANGKIQSQIVLAGDPKQLGPTVISNLAEVVLGKSILERLMSYDVYQKDHKFILNPMYITKLVFNYRNHPSIMHIPNKLFYENELMSMFKGESEREKFSIRFHGVNGTEKKYPHSSSCCNEEEIEIVIQYVEALTDKNAGRNVSPEEIGIITPFSLQSKMIKKRLERKNITKVDVGTVELFQGQERKVIIMTTVRSQIFFHDDRVHLGFLSNSKRFNVAVTRAQNLLIVIGNPAVLQTDNRWLYLMKYCLQNNSYRGIGFLMRSLSDAGNSEPIAIKTSQLFQTDYGTDLVKTLDEILYPEVDEISNQMDKLVIQNECVPRQNVQMSKIHSLTPTVPPNHHVLEFATPYHQSYNHNDDESEEIIGEDLLNSILNFL